MKLFFFSVFLFLFACGSSNVESDDKSALTDSTIKEAETIADEENIIIDEELPINDESEVSEEFEDVEWEDYEASMTQDFSFVILISTKDYDSALERAKEASEKLGYPIDLRDLHENDEIGLSLPRKVCEEDICGGGLDYPIYIPRSDWGESKYVSIEYSDGFEGFTTGYYIVVVASGKKGDPIIQEALEEAREFYDDAYAKTCGVWMGCGC